MADNEKLTRIIEKQQKVKRKNEKLKLSVEDEMQIAAKKFKTGQRVFMNGTTHLLDESSARNMGAQLHIASYGHFVTLGQFTYYSKPFRGRM